MFPSAIFGRARRKRHTHNLRRNIQTEDLTIPRYRSIPASLRLRTRKSMFRWILIALCLLSSIYTVYPTITPTSTNHTLTASPRVLQPHINTPTHSRKKSKHDPVKWLRKHSNMNHYETGQEWFNDRPKAAIISLVRNEELEGILQSMRQLEQRWNKRYMYPWMFFSEKRFSEEFKVGRPPIQLRPRL